MAENLVQVNNEDGIYIATFNASSHAAVDQYTDIMAVKLTEHLQQHTAEKPVSILIDVSKSGMFSVNYMNERVMAIFSPLPQIPKIYVAYLADRNHDKLVVSLVNSITVGKFDHSRRVFDSGQKQEAIQWLREVGTKA